MVLVWGFENGAGGVDEVVRSASERGEGRATVAGEALVRSEAVVQGPAERNDGERKLGLKLEDVIERQHREQFEIRLQELKQEVALAAEQESQIVAHYEDLVARIEENDLQAHGQLGALLAGRTFDGLADRFLTRGQKEVRRRSRERQRRVVAQEEVDRELANMMAIMDLSSDQQALVSQVLEAEFFGSLQEELSGENPTELEDVRESYFGVDELPDAEILVQVIEGMQETALKNRFDELEPILTKQQLEVYEKSIVNRTSLFDEAILSAAKSSGRGESSKAVSLEGGKVGP
ncbi:MAG: hypothetical protein AAGC74_11510 [Verrucomicrobiota bacterium]